jgi:hypothetical protein
MPQPWRPPHVELETKLAEALSRELSFQPNERLFSNDGITVPQKSMFQRDQYLPTKQISDIPGPTNCFI